MLPLSRKYQNNRPLFLILRSGTIYLFLFDLLKQNLSGHTDFQSLKSEITRAIENVSKKGYQKAFKNRLERIRFCINNNEDYYEYLIKYN